MQLSPELLDRVTAMARASLAADRAFVVVVNGVAGDAPDVPAIAADHPVYAAACSSEGPFVVDRPTQDERVRSLPGIDGLDGAGYFAGAALRRPDGAAYGLLCVLGGSAPGRASAASLDLFGDLARVAGERLASSRAVEPPIGVAPAGTPSPRERAVAAAIRAALSAGRLDFVLQPQFDLHTGTTAGFEAFLRLEDPDLGWIEPGEFLPVAQADGTIGEIGAWSLSRASELAAAVGKRFIALNLSRSQWYETTLLERLAEALAAAGARAQQLCLEVNLADLDADVERSRELCSALRSLGSYLYVDDVMPELLGSAILDGDYVDGLKIARRLMPNLGTVFASAGDEYAVRQIVECATRLGVPSIGGGIENKHQVEALKAARCTHGQGFFLGRPIEPNQLPKAPAR